jgi:hypothetical protein
MQQAPLNNINKGVGTVMVLSSGTLQAKWQNVLSKLPEGNLCNDGSFKTALKLFALKCCSLTARQEQKCFMKHSLGLPCNQLMLALLCQLQPFNKNLPYLPEVGNSTPMTTRKYCTTLFLQPITNGSTKTKLTVKSGPFLLR